MEKHPSDSSVSNPWIFSYWYFSIGRGGILLKWGNTLYMEFIPIVACQLIIDINIQNTFQRTSPSEIPLLTELYV